MMISSINAYSPREIAQRVEALGVTKTRSVTLSILVLAVLPGLSAPGSRKGKY